jgi:hypothetical protein
MITCQVESLTERLEEMKPMFGPHWSELALNQAEVPLDPQYDIYLAKDAIGEVLLVTAREAGKLIGYFVGFVAPGLHYRTCLTLQMDIFWIHPDYRVTDSLSAVEFDLLCDDIIEKVKSEAKRRGVKRAFMGSKLHKDISALFERHQGVEVERYWSFWLGD